MIDPIFSAEVNVPGLTIVQFKLEAYKLITRYSHGVVPPVVEYSRTENGWQFAQQTVGLVDWIERNIADIVGEG